MSTKASDREKRRAAALRQNLKRRKQALGAGADPKALANAQTAQEQSSDRPNKVKKPN
jgi:hypothetical protein